MQRALFFALLGYSCGSVLWARLFGRLMGRDVVGPSRDGNPGAANAFQYGGFWCGLFTLCGDLFKGFWPVWAYLRGIAPGETGLALALVMAAPVLGHNYSAFHHFKGGKGIAVSFGALLGLWPDLRPAALLAGTFLFFSLAVRVTPHYHRTILAFSAAAALALLLLPGGGARLGVLLIALLVDRKLLRSAEEKERCHIRPIWRS